VLTGRRIAAASGGGVQDRPALSHFKKQLTEKACHSKRTERQKLGFLVRIKYTGLRRFHGYGKVGSAGAACSELGV
jgi:hypothetical protein